MAELGNSSNGSFFQFPKPVMTSTQVGERLLSGSRPRRRLRPLDSDDDEEDGGDIRDVSAAPFPILHHPAVSPGGGHFSEGSEESDVDADGGGVDLDSVHSADEKGSDEAEVQDLDIKTLLQLKSISSGARKKTARRPQPKLDPQTILGERGLTALLKDFENVRFRGRGHEFEDLDKLMFIYESWANRMLPNFSFMDVIERLEAVGSKREVQSALRSMRAGTWPASITSEFVRDSSDSNSENEMPLPLDDPPESEDMQELLRLPEDESEFPKSPSPPPLHPSAPSTSTVVVETDQDQEEKGESVAARIERNRQAALQRLEEKRRASMPHTSISYRGSPSALRRALRPLHPSNNT